MDIVQNNREKHKLDLTGGESVYCINVSQMAMARKLIAGEDEAHASLRATFAATKELSRNDRAALAFLLIDELNNSRR